jgi:hypothetical protein
VAIVLVPIDVGVRRVALSRADLRRARAWIGRRVGFGRAEPEAVPGLAELRAARDRSARRAERPTRPVEGPEAVAPIAGASDAAPPGPPRAATEPQSPAPRADAPTEEPQGETLAERLARRRRGA